MEKRRYQKSIDRPKKRYPTDLFVDQADRLDYLVEKRNFQQQHVWSRAQVIQEAVEILLNENGLYNDGQTD